jgi:hypothetical protein
MQLPRRVFLDTNVVNFILDHGGSIFEGEPPENHLSERDLADIKALHFVFLTGERAHWELAVSPLTYQEISQTQCPVRRASLESWFQEVWAYWRDCFAEDGTLSDEYAEDLATKFGDSKLLQAFPDKSDRRLICHALAYECDTFCTRDHKTIIKKAKLIDAELPLEILTPKQWGERINALGGF